MFFSMNRVNVSDRSQSSKKLITNNQILFEYLQNLGDNYGNGKRAVYAITYSWIPSVRH